MYLCRAREVPLSQLLLDVRFSVCRLCPGGVFQSELLTVQHSGVTFGARSFQEGVHVGSCWVCWTHGTRLSAG